MRDGRVPEVDPARFAPAHGARARPDPDEGARRRRSTSDNCSGCHQSSGRGIPGVFPPLAGNPRRASRRDPNDIVKVDRPRHPGARRLSRDAGVQRSQLTDAAGGRHRELPAHELGQRRRSERHVEPRRQAAGRAAIVRRARRCHTSSCPCGKPARRRARRSPPRDGPPCCGARCPCSPRSRLAHPRCPRSRGRPARRAPPATSAATGRSSRRGGASSSSPATRRASRSSTRQASIICRSAPSARPASRGPRSRTTARGSRWSRPTARCAASRWSATSAAASPTSRASSTNTSTATTIPAGRVPPAWSTRAPRTYSIPATASSC